MHILIIITDYGSFNNFLSELAITMVQAGDIVDVICSEDKTIDIKDKHDYHGYGINFHFITFPRSFNIFKQYKTSYRINKLIEVINPDLVHIHFTTGLFTTLLYKRPKYVTLGTIHGLGFPVLKGARKLIFKFVEYFCLGRIDQLFVLNKFDLDIIGGGSSQKAFMLDAVGLGCDLDRFNPARFTGQHDSIKKNLHIAKEDFVITYTGRFVAFKGFDLVVRSFLKLNNQHPGKFKLLLIGGPDSIHPNGLTDEEEKEYIRCKQIIKVGFTLQVEKYLSISDVFLFPSLKEGMPVCMIEALAMAVPAITADSRGCNDLIVHKQNGILLSAAPTIDEVVQAVELLAESPELLQQMKNFAMIDRGKFSRNIFIERQIEVYNSITSLIPRA